MMWPVRIVGRPGILMSQMCDDVILRPSGSVTVIGLGVRRLLMQGAPFVRNREVAPVSATACDGSTTKPRAWCCTSVGDELLLDVTTVASSSSDSMAAEENIYWVGYGDLN